MLKAVSQTDWNAQKAAHLLNRAGFGGTPEEIQKLVDLGPEKAVESLVYFERIPDTTRNPPWAEPDGERLAKFRAYRDAPEEKKKELRKMEQKEQREQVQELRYWWLQRMAFGPRPLQEKLALFWHGHFATSIQKVKSAYYMWRQNEIFRRYGSGDWRQLLTEVSKDPAMLIWLDQAQSRKEHPNENFAREVMELFTLGEGHYTEKDITEAARAFTGWSLDRVHEEFIYRDRMHDKGEKTILGRTGNFSGDDVLVTIIIHNPQSSRFITRKLWTYFAGEMPSDEFNDALANSFRTGGYNFKPLLRTLFLSEEFYSQSIMRQQIKSPVQWLIGSVRLLERELPPAPLSINALRSLGQDLLAPPNVKGWDGGLSWITTNNLLNRYNFAGYLVLGENPLAPAPRRKTKPRRRMPIKTHIQVEKLFPPEVRTDKTKLLAAIEQRFLQSTLSPAHRSAARAYLESEGELDDADILQAIRLVMSTPEYQLA